MDQSTSPPRNLPCVVQLGFAGARRLFDLPVDKQESTEPLDSQVQQYLTERLASLSAELGLAESHFLCGISQIAIGGDVHFTRACQTLDIPQRIFLPQHRDTFLTAIGSSGKPDFDDKERKESVELLASPHVIQERLVSDASDRTTRFQDANHEIVRVSDVVICLLREDTEGQAGGTHELLELAKSQEKPALEIRVAVRGGSVEFREGWHGKEGFSPPALPDAIAALPAPNAQEPHQLPTVAEYCDVVKTHVSKQARRHSQWFARAALVVIGTHIVATLCATIVLSFEPAGKAALLGAELILLSMGFLVHRSLHRSHPSKLWALSRLMAEINRSVRALGKIHLYLQYLFRLRLPDELRALLRTLNTLHLRSTCDVRKHMDSGDQWADERDAYLKNRLTDPEQGQIAYYTNSHTRESRHLRRATWLFAVCSLVAIVATAVKLIFEAQNSDQEIMKKILGTLAIVLPVLAVGFLSWAAAKDYEARVHTFGEMVRFLEQQQVRLQNVASARELQRLVEETESRLLGETAEWYSRRTFTGVA